MKRTLALLLLLIAGCGSRTGLDVSLPAASVDASIVPDAAVTRDAGTCLTPEAGRAPTCSSWTIAGADRLVSAASNGADSAMTLGAVVPAGCGVLLGWTTSTYVDPSTSQLSWSTRLVGFDGAPIGPEVPHPSLAIASQASGGIELAVAESTVGALVMDEVNCRFLPLDASGNETGAPTALAPSSDAACVGLAARASGGFSYLAADGANGLTPSSLVTLDDVGHVTTTQPLGDTPGYALWGRLVLGDGSFLLNAFREDATTGTYTGVLQRFDATGGSLSGPVAQPVNAAPLMLAATPSGALASWWPDASEEGAAFEPLAMSGAASGPSVELPFTGAPYGEALASTPSGDVLVELLELNESTASETWTVDIQERTPAGAARGSPLTITPFGSDFDPGDVTPIVAPDGVHALLVYEGNGIHTLPLACAH